MRRAALLASLFVAASARADTFGGFSGVDRPYLVNQDRVCAPLAVSAGAATGAPKCEKAAADAIAHLSIKPPLVQSGAKASFAAQAAGKTITVSRKTGGVVVAWDAPDPIVRIVDTYASQYDDRVAVAYVTRRAGKEVTDVVAFDLGQGQTAVAAPDPATAIVAPTRTTDVDPKVQKALADARKAPRARAAAAWRAVLDLDPAVPEARYRLAALDIVAKRAAEALAGLAAIAASDHADAIEWLVEARFDPAFAALRSDPKFRAAVGLDRKGSTAYERLMGFGGQWEQTGTSCDRPEVRFVASRDRAFKLRVKTTCEGSVFDTPFKGTWRLDGNQVVLQLPNQGKITASDEATCRFESAGDEDALRCALGRDLEFVVLPTRR